MNQSARITRAVLAAALGLAVALGTVAGASADTGWGKQSDTSSGKHIHTR